MTKRLRYSTSVISQAFLALVILMTGQAMAVDGTWFGVSGSWNNNGAWFGGTIADGADYTANFTGVDISADQTITLGADRTIGSIIFTDSTTPSHNLTISGTNTLTLDVTSGSPTVNVTQSGRKLTISSPIAGNDGLTKTGAGTLLLSATNSWTGGFTLNDGRLEIADNVTQTVSSSILLSGGSTNMAIIGGTLNLSGVTITRNGNYGSGFAAGGPVDTVTSGVTGSPNVTMNIYYGAVNDYIAGMQFAPAGSATQVLGNITLVRINHDKGGLTLGGDSTGNTVTSISNSGGAGYGVVRKRGPGTWTLGNLSFGSLQKFTGTTIAQGNIDGGYVGERLYGGTLILDYTGGSSINTTRLGDGPSLYLNGGTLQLDRSTGASGSHVEVVSATYFSGGLANITRGSGSAATLRMNAITRSAGAALNLGAAGIADTDTLNTNGIIGPWATLAGADFACNSTGAPDGAIYAYSGYADVSRPTGTINDGPAVNVRLTGGSGSSIGLGATTTTINTLNQSAWGGTGSATIDSASKTLAVNGILAGAGSGSLTIGASVGSGILMAGSAGGELILHNYSSNPLTINSVIADNTSASRLTLAGTGTTILAGVNTYSGATLLAGGVLDVGLNAAGLSSSSYLQLAGGVLQANGAFTRGNSITAGGASFQWALNEDGSGFAAKGSKLTVKIGNNAGTEQVWALFANGIGVASDNNAILGPLKFGSSTADSEVEFQNKVDLNGETRVIDVADNTGSTNDFATMSGVIRNSSTVVPAGIYKTGQGALKLSGTNTYNGPTVIKSGRLLMGVTNSIPSGGAVTLAGGILDAGDLNCSLGQLCLLDNSTIEIGSGRLAFSGATGAWSGELTLTGKLGPNTLRVGTDANGLTKDQLSLIRYKDDIVVITDQGYIVPVQRGTVIIIR